MSLHLIHFPEDSSACSSTALRLEHHVRDVYSSSLYFPSKEIFEVGCQEGINVCLVSAIVMVMIHCFSCKILSCIPTDMLKRGRDELVYVTYVGYQPLTSQHGF